MFPTSINSVLLLDGIDNVCKEILLKSGIKVTVMGKQTNDELVAIIGDYDAIVVRSATKVTAQALETGAKKRLRLVGRAGTGTDNIDVKAATKFGVIVMNTPGGNTLSAAEHTCALICSLGRFLPQACASLKNGQWDRKKYMGNELYGKTLAIVGLGRIGREVASRMQSFGMTTIGYDPFVSREDAAACNIQKMSLEEIWPKADYITVHTPLLPHTKNLVGEEVLTKLTKKGVKIINVARGGIVDEEALLNALNSGDCGGAGLDVFVNEPPLDFTLCSHQNVVCTPHLGASTAEAQKRVAEEIATQIVSGKEGKTVVGLVNAHGLSVSGNKVAEEYMSLGASLGKVAFAFLDPKGKEAFMDTITYGKKYESYYMPVKSGALAGYLNKLSNGASNVINVSSFASKFGIIERECRKEDIATACAGINILDALKVQVVTSMDTVSVIGTVMGGTNILFGLNNVLLPSPIFLSKSSAIMVFKGKTTSLQSVISGLTDSGMKVRTIYDLPEIGDGHFIVTVNKEQKFADIPNVIFLGSAVL